MLALAMIFGWWMALVPLAIFCLIVAVMKGPRRQAGSKGPVPD